MRIFVAYTDEYAAMLYDLNFNSQTAFVLKTTTAYCLRDTDCVYTF